MPRRAIRLSDPPPTPDPPPSVFRWRFWLFLTLLGPLFAALAWLAGRAPDGVEYWYARGTYPWIAGGMARLTGWTPWSVAEWILYGLPLVFVTWALVAWFRRGEKPLGVLVGRGLLRFTGILGALMTLFVLLWGLNYRRQPLATQLGWDAGPFPPSELERMAQDLRTHLERLAPVVPRRPDGTLQAADPNALLAQAAQGFSLLPPHWHVHHSLHAAPKRLFHPSTLSRCLTYGVFSPWTGEAHLNTDIPTAAWAFTACHELAHQKGYAREDEANFLAWAAASNHPDPTFRYAAALWAFHEAVSQVTGDAAKVLTKDLPPGVVADWHAASRWRDRWASPVSRASQRVYATYLKSQGEADGMRSYGRFLDLMLAQRRAEGTGR